ncbi:S41 family peptidase [Natronoglycomyces albus]|uniref:Tricorn protease homolog n=1 Tax=Natronoglycomyces albus TaxID=2811108 RepID=A0A895XRC0_9ACTN|nr:S41 family peptidase [Natronoglycomyces albus]QSB04148.1 PDZ domain-containing protein [Natronoglycomyces albus]
MALAYPRYPTLNGNLLAFVAEDDLWSVAATGGTARRLTSTLGSVTATAFSPDGEHIAFVGNDEGTTELYLVSAEGGLPQQLTYQGDEIIWVGWNPEGTTIRYASNATNFTRRRFNLWEVAPGGRPTKLPVGMATAYSEDHAGNSVVARTTPKTEPAHWKRYRGGNAGHFWIDSTGDGTYRLMSELRGNVSCPQLLGDRLYFLSDHEGIGNVYSCRFDGSDQRRHTDHDDYYARGLTCDGRRLAYHCGAELYLLDPIENHSRHLGVDLPATNIRTARRFVDPMTYLQGATLSPDGSTAVVNTRGKLFALRPWDGPVRQLGEVDGTGYRLPTWLHNGTSLLALASTADEPEHLVRLDATGLTPPQRIEFFDLANKEGTREVEGIGRIESICASPISDQVALCNHRGQLLLADLGSPESDASVLVESDTGSIEDVEFSPDGRWLTYSIRLDSPDGTESTPYRAIYLHNLETGASHLASRPVLSDERPTFDPDGKFLYFIGRREYEPAEDALHLDIGFPWGSRPYAVALSRDTPAPFDDEYTPPTENDAAVPARIDAETAPERLVPFPLEAGNFQQLFALKGKVLTLSNPLKPAASADLFNKNKPGRGILRCVDLKTGEVETIAEDVSQAWLSSDASTLMYRSGEELRVITPDEKVSDEDDPGKARFSKQQGWIDVDRIKLSVLPAAEWGQIFAEGWSLQRDYFWIEHMGGIDWQAVFDRYRPLVDRVASRAEFSDLMQEMQGELSSSHAYEMLGDYIGGANYPQGKLGASFSFDSTSKTYRIDEIVIGDRWKPTATSPLNRPGVNAAVGEELLAVNGMSVGPEASPEQRLANLANQKIELVLRSKSGTVRAVNVTALADDRPARYRDWVESNRAAVHEATGGRVGYIHIPDMMSDGYAEFHRSYFEEVSRHALIVDLRFNSGGRVSALLWDRLDRTRFGHMVARNAKPFAVPRNVRRGPLVTVTNEFAGSDGDIGTHTFKMRGLGPVIGRRTWGGVVGISVRFFLADNTLVTQPEIATHMNDVGWDVENYGSDPDIEVEYAPQDFAAGKDPQLDAAIANILDQLETAQVATYQASPKPNLTFTSLPARPQDR